MNKGILIIVVILIMIVGGYFLLRGGYRASVPVAPEITEEEVPAPEVKEVTVVGTEFSFNPSSITVSAGEQVRIIFRNEGRAPHNLIVEGLGVETRIIGGGQVDIIEFTAPASRNYTFFCSVAGHRAAGMIGSLIVQ